MDMNIISFVPEQLGILVAALWVIGYFVKNTKKIPDAYIPFILIVLSVIASLFIMGANVVSVLQGIICAAVAVLGSNVIKQGSELLSVFSSITGTTTDQKETDNK